MGPEKVPRVVMGYFFVSKAGEQASPWNEEGKDGADAVGGQMLAAAGGAFLSRCAAEVIVHSIAMSLHTSPVPPASPFSSSPLRRRVAPRWHLRCWRHSPP